MENNVTGVFEHISAANDAVTALVDAGIAREDVHVIPAIDPELRHADRHRDPHVVRRDVIEPQNGAAMGFVGGFLLGGLVGVLMATGDVTIMGMGPAMRAGPFLAGVVGALVLGFGGALAGWVLNAPLPKIEEPLSSPILGLESLAHPHRGTPDTTIVHVLVDETRAAEVRAILERFKGHDNVGVWRRTDGSWEPASA